MNQHSKKDDSILKQQPIRSNDTTVARRNNNPYNPPTLAKCFRCGQQGHLSNECPQRRTLAVQEEEDGADGCNSEDNEELAYLQPDDGDQLSCVLQQVLLTPKSESHPQRHSLFRTRCTINGRVCQIIIDSGSSKNIVSKKLVTALNLKAKAHPIRIGLAGSKKGEKQWLKTKLETLTNTKLHAMCWKWMCHLLLGRP